MDALLQPGAWAIGWLGPIFDLFKSDEFAPAIALYGLVIAFLLLLEYLRRVVLICRDIRNSSRTVQGVDGPDMLEGLSSIETDLKGKKFLRHAWLEFEETLIKPEPNDSSRVVLNTSRPHDFFNATASGLEFRFFHALPAIFVGGGLLLTFFGLVSALYFATKGISESASVANTQEELKGLLHAASFKFYTSISGLLASLVFVVSLRVGGRSIDHAFNHLCEQLESRLQFVTTEGLALKQLHLAEQNNEQLVRLNTDIAVAIGQRVEEALNATLPTHLSKPLEELNSSLGSVAGNLSEINTEAVNEMGRAFNDELTRTTREQFDQLAVVLQDLKSSLEGLGERLSDSGSNLTEGVQSSTSEMRSAIDLLTDKVVHMATSLEDGASRSDEAMNQQIQALNERIGQVTQTLAESLESVGSNIMERTQAAAGEFAGQVAGAAGAFESASAVAAKRIEEAVTKVTQGAEAAGERASADVEESSLALKTALQSAAEEFARIEQQIAEHRNAIRSISQGAEQTGKAAKDAADSFRESAQPLQKIAQDMATASRETQAQVSGLDNTMRTIQRQITETSEALSAAAEISNSASKRFEGVDKQLGQVLERLVREVESVMGRFHTFVGEMDLQLNKSVGHLSGWLEALEELVEELKESTGRTDTDEQGQR